MCKEVQFLACLHTKKCNISKCDMLTLYASYTSSSKIAKFCKYQHILIRAKCKILISTTPSPPPLPPHPPPPPPPLHNLLFLFHLLLFLLLHFLFPSSSFTFSSCSSFSFSSFTPSSSSPSSYSTPFSTPPLLLVTLNE